MQDQETKQSLAHDYIVWVDIETTGLNKEKDVVLETACIITDHLLNHIESVSYVIHHPNEILDGMDDWCKKQHGKSGLIDEIKNSTTTLAEAEKGLLALVKKYTLPKTAPMGGNSVHFDRAFLEKYMPNFVGHLSYRNVDVSSIMELCKRWCPLVNPYLGQGVRHRAMDDIKSSISQAERYKQALFEPRPVHITYNPIYM
jgi:oligoribonuclease